MIIQDGSLSGREDDCPMMTIRRSMDACAKCGVKKRCFVGAPLTRPRPGTRLRSNQVAAFNDAIAIAIVGAQSKIRRKSQFLSPASRPHITIVGAPRLCGIMKQKSVDGENKPLRPKIFPSSPPSVSPPPPLSSGSSEISRALRPDSPRDEEGKKEKRREKC